MLAREEHQQRELQVIRAGGEAALRRLFDVAQCQ